MPPVQNGFASPEVFVNKRDYSDFSFLILQVRYLFRKTGFDMTASV